MPPTSDPLHPSVIIRGASAATSAGSAGSGPVQAQFARRLAAMGLVSAGLWSLVFITTFLFQGLGFDVWAARGDAVGHTRTIARALAVIAAVDGLGVWWALRRRGDGVGRGLLNMAVGYQVATAMAFAVLDVLPLLNGPQQFMGVPAVCVWLVFFPSVVPLDPLRSAIGSALSALAVFSVFGLVTALGYVALSGVTVFWVVFSVTVAAVLAQIPAGVVRRLGQQVSEALDLGAYRLERPLGSGGMGEVWVAHHRLLARPAAIKLIKPTGDAGDGAAAHRRFAREARVTAALRSPHTVEVYDYGLAADGRFYYAMELLNGFDLDSLVRTHGPQPAARVVGWLRQICDSLGEAHGVGLVHRDVKPANVMVCPGGPQGELVKVLDFGLVRVSDPQPADGVTREGGLAGTPAFMAPELALGAPPDGRTDLYAVGCVAFWLLTGRAVFEASNAAAMVAAHLRDPPDAASDWVRGVPPALDAIVTRCLAKAPADRFADARALADALDALGPVDGWGAAQARAWWAAHPAESSPAVHESSHALEWGETVAP